MKGKDKTYDLRQRVLRLGNQKLEEEELYKKIREAISRPPVSNPALKHNQPKTSPNQRANQASVS